MRAEQQVLCQSQRPRAVERYLTAVKADLTLVNQNVEGKKKKTCLCAKMQPYCVNGAFIGTSESPPLAAACYSV